MTINTRNQAKWDSLQDAGSSTIDTILAGKASDKDLKALSTLLTDQHELAGQIFDEGVENAKQTADSIVDRLNEERIASGKRALTQKAFDRIFQSTFQRVMSQAIEDILGQVQDEFENQSAEIRDRMEEALEKIRNMPTSQGTGDAPRNRMDRLTQAPDQRQSSSEEQQLNQTLMDRVLDRHRPDDGSSNAILTSIKETLVATRDKITSLYDQFTRHSEDGDEEKRASIWMRKLKSVFNPVKNAYGKAKAGASKLGSLLEMIGKPLLLAVMNPQLIKSITDAVSQYLSFDKISGYVSNMWDETKKIGSDSIDWIIDKVKAFFGFGKDKPKTPASEVKKVDPLTQNTMTGELPKSITSKDAEQKLPATAQALDTAKKSLSAAEARYAANPTAANKKAVDDAKRNVTFWQTRFTQYTKRSNESRTAGSDIGQAASITPPTQSTSNSATPMDEVPKAIMPSGGVDSPRTTGTAQAADPSAVLNGSSAVTPPKTEVIGESPQFLPGKAYDAPDKQAEDKVSKQKRGAAIAQIGLGSFGFDSVDSSLNILNLGMIS